jgi:tetratricopeptide (TPR) repeat protein
MADDRLTRMLKWVAVALGVGFVAWAAWDHFVTNRQPGDLAYHDANNLFEDGHYQRAVEQYQAALSEAPDHVDALRGLARSLHQMGQWDQALAVYDEAIALAPDFGASYANRGILLDTMGRHEEALADYDQAFFLDPELADGPHWLTRFLRNQPDAPSTIADRAGYLRAELAKPEAERLLRIPEQDAQQRTYKQ